MRRFLFGLGLALATSMPNGAQADTATDSPPLIGKLQVLRWNGLDTGQTDNTPLDGTILCAAFGGPDHVPPPSPFSGAFSFDGGLEQFRPNTVDVAVTTPAINSSDRNANWIYAFQVFNDEGDEPTEGGAAINSINISLPPCTSGIDNGFPDTINSIPGGYVTEYGSTLQGGGLVPFFQIQVFVVGIGRQFALIYAANILEESESSEIFYYYSPFSPSNRNASINGGNGGQALAHATAIALVTAQFYPKVRCENIALVGSTPGGGETVYDFVSTMVAEYGSLDLTNDDPFRVGNVLLIDDPVFGPTLLSDTVAATFTATDSMTPCISFRLPGGGDFFGPLGGSIEIDRGGDAMVAFSVAVPDACPDIPIVSGLATATAPYDRDPPFEGHTKFGMPTNPDLDADLDVPCSVFFLAPPDPGTDQTNNVFRFSGAASGGRVFLIAGVRSGSIAIPGCPGLAADMSNPRLAGTATADSQGLGQVSLDVPMLRSGLTVRFQLVQKPPCGVSNLVLHTFP